MLCRSLLLLFLFLLASTNAHATPPPIPNSHIAQGTQNIEKAWLATPTTRYAHFVLGDQFEAASLVAELKSGELLELQLDKHLVFEDRHVRLADLDSDGSDEMIVVMSSTREGAALAVFGIVDGKIELKAQTPFIGTPNRWLNPAGIADYDGDGNLEIAIIVKPHLTKRLEFWRMENGILKRVDHIDGISNHRLGSHHQGLSETFDVDGNGVADLIVPDASRTRMLTISLSTNEKIIQAWPLPAPVDGDIKFKRDTDTPTLLIPLQSDDVHLLPLR